jgi:hypothetical protein
LEILDINSFPESQTIKMIDIADVVNERRPPNPKKRKYRFKSEAQRALAEEDYVERGMRLAVAMMRKRLRDNAAFRGRFIELLHRETRSRAARHRMWHREFSSGEAQELLIREIFDTFDYDGNGLVDKNEFAKLTEYLEIGLHADTNLFWDSIDSDKSGSIDFAEFYAWYQRAAEDSGAGEDGRPRQLVGVRSMKVPGGGGSAAATSPGPAPTTSPGPAPTSPGNENVTRLGRRLSSQASTGSPRKKKRKETARRRRFTRKSTMMRRDAIKLKTSDRLRHRVGASLVENLMKIMKVDQTVDTIAGYWIGGDRGDRVQQDIFCLYQHTNDETRYDVYKNFASDFWATALCSLFTGNVRIAPVSAVSGGLTEDDEEKLLIGELLPTLSGDVLAFKKPVKRRWRRCTMEVLYALRSLTLWTAQAARRHNRDLFRRVFPAPPGAGGGLRGAVPLSAGRAGPALRCPRPSLAPSGGLGSRTDGLVAADSAANLLRAMDAIEAGDVRLETGAAGSPVASPVAQKVELPEWGSAGKRQGLTKGKSLRKKRSTWV